MAGYQLKESIAAYGSEATDQREEEAGISDANTIPWKWDDSLEW
jgi:hypothetical protein